MVQTFHQLPTELLYQIALYLPLTKDVLAFALTNSRIRWALSTPSLFKARLALQGWDITAWKDKDDAAQSPGDLKRWMSIDHIYCRTIQLFDEAAVDHGHFLITTHTPIIGYVLWGSEQPTKSPGQDNRITSDSRQVIDGHRTVNWLEKLSKVLPLFVTHHRGGNISRITDTKYRDSLRAYARVVHDIYTIGDELDSVALTDSESNYAWFEPICFSLIALLIQCDSTTITSIFTDTYTVLAPTMIFVDIPVVLWNLEERCFSAFLIQAVLCIMLHLNAERPSMPESERPPLLAPIFPHFEPHTTPSYSYYSYFGDGMPVGPAVPTIMTMVRITTPSALPSSTLPYMRPWLRDELAGTPLARLSSTVDRAWVGYYTHFDRERRDQPMYLKLRTSSPPPDSNSDLDIDSHSDLDSDPNSRMSYFCGEGHDGVGEFTISGRCNTHTGIVRIIKAYEAYQWRWHGMLTPFGMAGIWSPERYGGWWWFWPQEWSPATTR